MEIKDLENLANLCRIDLAEDEKKDLLVEMDSILSFVDQIQKVDVSGIQVVENDLINVMREDKNPYPGGEFSQALLAEAPSVQDDYIKVKKIL